MPYRTVLHIGMHKTGTSAIQRICSDNARTLLEAGLYWPEERLPDNPDQHSDLARWIRTGNSDRAIAYFQRARQAAMNTNAECLLLSGEGFSRLNRAQINLIKEALEGNATQIVLYVRNVYGFLASAMSERMKHGNFFGSGRNGLKHMLGLLNFDRIITDWENIFGQDNVRVYLYKDGKENVVSHFLSELHVPPSVIQTFKDVRINLSLPFSLIIYLHMTGLCPDTQSFRKWARTFAQSGAAKGGWSQQQINFIDTLVDASDLSLDHPKLASFKTHLLELPQPTLTNEDIASQINVLSSMVGQQDIPQEKDAKSPAHGWLKRIGAFNSKSR